MRFAVESWSPEYGTAADATSLGEATGTVDAGIEVPVGDWAPLTPPPVTGDAVPARIGFVDGVRRIDARVWVLDGSLTRPGVCAVVAAGLVVAGAGEARVERCCVRRAVVTAAADAGPILTRGGTYELRPVADDTAEGLYLGVHDLMTSLEVELSEQARCDLVVFDGPLRGRRHPDGVGYVKTQHVQYLPDDAQAVLGRLDPGQRSPVFLIDQRGFTRWSWYQRLPGPRAHPLAGVIRCELAGVGTAVDAAARADVIAGLLPRFASEAHKDPRAPQNLYPIAGLEQALRRHLGDPHLAERALRLAAGHTSSLG